MPFYPQEPLTKEQKKQEAKRLKAVESRVQKGELRRHYSYHQPNKFVFGNDNQILEECPDTIYDIQEVEGKGGRLASFFLRREKQKLVKWDAGKRIIADTGEYEKGRYHLFNGFDLTGECLNPYRKFDVHGIDIMMPELAMAEVLTSDVSVTFRIGEKNWYVTNLCFMHSSDGMTYRDEFRIPIFIPSSQNFSVMIDYYGNQPRSIWESGKEQKRFGCRLRGVLYRELC